MNRFLIVVCILISFAGIVAAQPATPTPAAADPCAEVAASATRAETKLKDWPALVRYHDADMKVTAPAKSEDRVVFMGDSITDSWQSPSYGGVFPAKPHINRGIGEHRPQQGLVLYPPPRVVPRPHEPLIMPPTKS